MNRTKTQLDATKNNLFKNTITINLYVLYCICVGIILSFNTTAQTNASPILAQDWTPFPANQKTWFEFRNGEHYSTSLYYANRVVESGDSTLYYMDANNTLELILDDCENDADFDAEAVDFISILEPYVETEGKYYFKDQLVFDTNLNPGEGIFIQSENYTGFDEVYLECTELRTDTIFGQSDEVKLYSLKAYTNSQPIESSFDTHNYTLSKSFGFLQFLPFIELLKEAKTTATITGFINEQGNLSGSKGVVGNNYRTPYEAGDVIYYSEDSIIGLGIRKHKIIWRDSITSVTNYGDSIRYIYDRIEHIVKENWYEIILDTVVTTQNNIGKVNFDEVINADVFKSIYGYALEEIPQNGNVKHFSIDQSLNSFSLEKDRPTANVKVQNITNVSSEDCRFSILFFYGHEIYHSQLGKINNHYRDHGGIDYSRNIKLYKKGSQTYTPFAPLDSLYTTSDRPVNLLNDYYNTGAIFSGPGVANTFFYPELVPDSLLNVPFEITHSLDIWDFKQTIMVIDVNDTTSNTNTNNLTGCSSLFYYGHIAPPAEQDTFIVNPATMDTIPVTYYDAIPNYSTLEFVPQLSLLGFDLNYFWDFGDGTSVADINPTHHFLEDGTYTVCLTLQPGICVDEATYCEDISIPLNQQNFTIRGSVRLPAAIVYLIAHDEENERLDIIDVAPNSFLNRFDFVFYNVPPGKYFIKAAAMPGWFNSEDYLPTYYGDVLLWEDATFIEVTDSNIEVIEINLVKGENTFGPGFISGLITDGAGKLQSKGLANAEVLLFNESNEPIRYTYTDATGFYSFSNLPAGIYWVTADVPGIQFPMIKIVIEAGSLQLENIEVTAENQPVFIGLEEHAGPAVRLYPNPNKGILNISTTLPYTKIKIYNTNGALVFSDNQTRNTYSQNLSSGIYLVEILNQNEVLAIEKLIVQ